MTHGKPGFSFGLLSAFRQFGPAFAVWGATAASDPTAIVHIDFTLTDNRPTRGVVERSRLGDVMPYEYLDVPAAGGGRIHFRHRDAEDDPAEYVKPATLAEKGIAFAYVDATLVDEYEALNLLGRQLRTDHPPYDPEPSKGMSGWFRFMDDLETLGDREAGMVIVINNAATLFADAQSWGFKLIEMWVLQLPRWQKRNAPCHLAFQMEADAAVEQIYGTKMRPLAR